MATAEAAAVDGSAGLRRDTRRRWPRRMLAALMLLCAPLVVMGIVATPNEYAALGIDDAVDCDGPLDVLLFAAPALAVYALGLVVSFVDILRRRSRGSRVMFALCAAVCALLASNVVAAYGEQSRDAHRLSCMRN